MLCFYFKRVVSLCKTFLYLQPNAAPLVNLWIKRDRSSNQLIDVTEELITKKFARRKLLENELPTFPQKVSTHSANISNLSDQTTARSFKNIDSSASETPMKTSTNASSDLDIASNKSDRFNHFSDDEAKSM